MRTMSHSQIANHVGAYNVANPTVSLDQRIARLRVAVREAHEKGASAERWAELKAMRAALQAEAELVKQS